MSGMSPNRRGTSKEQSSDKLKEHLAPHPAPQLCLITDKSMGNGIMLTIEINNLSTKKLAAHSIDYGGGGVGSLCRLVQRPEPGPGAARDHRPGLLLCGK